MIVSDGTYFENLLIQHSITLKSELQSIPAVIDGSLSDPSDWNGSCIVVQTPSGRNSRITAIIEDMHLTGGKGSMVIEDGNGDGDFDDASDYVKKVGGGMIVHQAGLLSRRNKIINNGDITTNKGGGVYAAGTGAGVPDNNPNLPPNPDDNERIVISFEGTIFSGNDAGMGHTVMVNGLDAGDQSIQMNFGNSYFDVVFNNENDALDGVSEYWVRGIDNFIFDFSGGISGENDAILTDVWVDPINGQNEGNFIGDMEHPFLTIDYAMGMIYQTEEDQITIHLTANTFSPTTENFPIVMLSNIILDGSGMDNTFLDGGGIDRVLFYDNAYETLVKELTIQNGVTPEGEQTRYGWGGGILASFSDVELIDVKISENVAFEHGGGFMLEKSKLKMLNSIISDNVSHGSGGGGHVSTYVSLEAEFYDVVIRDNVGSVGGGLALNANSIFENVIIENNINEYVDNYTAGGLYLNGNHQINNSVISGNHGGAIHAAVSADVKIINSIINNNDDGLGEITINGTWNGTANTRLLIGHSNIVGGMDAIQFGVFASIDDVVWLEGNIDENPLFMGDDDFSLQENSPCIDAGIAYLEYDGEILIDMADDMYVDGDGDGVSLPDMGAIEWYPLVFGCMDQIACNYDYEANIDDGSCEYPEANHDCAGDCLIYIDCLGVCGGGASYDNCGVCDGDDSSCLFLGDMNYDGYVNVMDIVMTVDLVLMNQFDEVADVNEDGHLNVLDIVMLVDWVLNGLPSNMGCTDELACNYDPDIDTDDGSCIYPEENYDCAGNCLTDIDCAGICGGNNSSFETCCGLPINENCTSDCHVDDLDVCCTLNDIDECGMCFGNGSSCSPTITDIDGNVYGTVQIGGKLWTTENLKVTRYNNEDPILTGHSDAEWADLDLTETGAYSVFIDDQDTDACGDNCAEVYGNLYNWYAVNDERGLCPEGFHVPSDDEYKELEIYLGMSDAEANAMGSRGLDEGGKLKEVGYEHWTYPNAGATNETGLSLLGSGLRGRTGTYEYLLFNHYAWTSSDCSIWEGEIPGCMDLDACNYDEEATVDDGNCNYNIICYDPPYECQPIARYLHHAVATIARTYKEYESGLSVRCIQD